jgi:glycosyltransferase involved in cell wall biosynthesis
MISVCMAVYNGEKYIAEQLTSILNQLDANDELIVADDGSLDSTLSILDSFSKDSRVRLFRNSFKSPILNFGNALSKAKGDYIFLCDQDDIWLPTKVKDCIALLKKFDLVVTDCKIVDENLLVLNDSYFDTMDSGPGLLKNLKQNTYLGCCMCFQKKLLPLVLPFPNKIPMHDIWIGFVADIFFRVKFTKSPLVLYRRHNNNASSTTQTSKYSLFQKGMFRYHLIKNIPLLFFRYLKTIMKK